MLPLRRSVADLSLFCEKCLQPLRAEQALTKEQEAAVFSNWEVIRGVNQQLLDALSAPAPEDPLVRAAAAFESMAPWLKSYSVYSANFVTAQEKLDKLRSESAEVDKACGAVEALIQMSLGSMLIKPVQRLCKYPLLFRELLHEITLTLTLTLTLTRRAAARDPRGARAPRPRAPRGTRGDHRRRRSQRDGAGGGATG